MRVIFDTDASLLRGRNASEQFNVTKSAHYLAVGGQGAVSQITIDDAIFDYTDKISTNSVFDITTSNVVNAVTATNLTPSIATFDSTHLNFVSDGDAVIEFSDGHTTKQISGAVRENITQASSQAFNSFIPGSLARALDDSITALVLDKTASATTTEVTATNNWVDTIVRNPDLWCSSLDLSAIALASAAGGGNLTAISPWHVIGANHYFNSAGLWVDSNGTIVSRTVTASQQIGTSDIRIGVLNAALPSTVSPMEVMPSNWRNYIPGYLYNIPCAYFDLGEVGSAKQCGILSTYQIRQASDGILLDFEVSPDADKAAFYRTNVSPSIDFNSGSPVFFILGATPILLGTWYYAGEAPIISDYITEINAAMASLYGSNSHQLQQINISEYLRY